MTDTNTFDPTDPLWHQAVMQQESAGDPDAVSSAGAEGKMQTMPATQRDPGFGVRPAQDDSPEEKERVGHDYLNAMGQKYSDPNLSLIAYNYGPKNTDAWIANGADPKDLPPETRDYVKKVTQNYQDLKTQANTTVTAQNTPAAYTTVAQVDPLGDALSAPDEKNLSPAKSTAPISADPLGDALSEQASGSAPAPGKVASSAPTASAQPPIGYGEDIARTIPGAVVRGLGAIPQIPAYAGNFAASLLGQGVGATHDLFSDTPYTEAQHNALKNVQPFYTGATPLEQAARVTEGLSGQFKPGEIRACDK